MARPKSTGKVQTPQYSMVNVDFSQDQRVEINLWLEENRTDMQDIFLQVVDAGFKFSFSLDEYNECYVGSLTRKKYPKPTPTRNVYLLRHAEFTKLLQVVKYFFVVLLQKGDNEYVPKGGQFSW